MTLENDGSVIISQENLKQEILIMTINNNNKHATKILQKNLESKQNFVTECQKTTMKLHKQFYPHRWFKVCSETDPTAAASRNTYTCHSNDF